MQDKQVLEGFRVLEVGGTIAGWVAGMLLADYGAEVIHVDPPARAGAGPVPGEAMWHRGKACAVIDWSDEADVASLRALVAGADVCITTDAAVEEELGLAGTANRRLVHLAMPTCVPLEAGGIEVDALLSAAFGIARRQCSFDGGPVDAVYPFVLYAQGLWGATTAVAALYERERSGLGQRVEVDGVHGVFAAATGIYVIDPTSSPMDTAVGPGGRTTSMAPYRCADGEWLFFIGIGSFMRAAYEALGLEWVLDDPRVKGSPANLESPDNRPWVLQAVVDAFASQPRENWLRTLSEAGCPVASIASPDEWLDHPQVEAIGQRRTLQDPVDGEVVMGGTLVDLSATPPAEPQPRRFVAVGELPRWEPQPAAPADAVAPAANGPLDGVRVINLGLFFAGPFAGQLLADLGADVAKVERLGGSNSRDGGFHYIRGQRSLAIDLRDPSARAAFLELARRADVVIDNFRPGVLERLGIDHGTLQAVKPNLITASISAFGDTGPLAAEPGMDPILQAMSGMMAAQGGDNHPVLYTIGPNDDAGAGAAAFGVCLALLHRARGGGGQRVSTSLVAGSVFMQSGELLRASGRPPARRGGRDYAGPSAIDRLYATADGHVRLYAGSRDPFVAAGLLSDAAASEEEATAEIQEALSALACDQALERLAAAGIAAVPARHLGEIPLDPAIVAGRYLVTYDSVDGTTLYLPGRLARFSRTERRDVLRTAGVGEHSRELLLEAGVEHAAIDAAIEAGVVAQGGPVIWFSEAAGRY